MKFIGNYHPQIAKPGLAVNAGGDQHAFQRFRCGQQNIGRIFDSMALLRLRNIAVPHCDTSADQPSVIGQTLLKVVQQGLDGADINHAHAWPRMRHHSR